MPSPKSKIATPAASAAASAMTTSARLPHNPRSKTRTSHHTLMQFCGLCTARFYVHADDEGAYPLCCKKCDRKHARLSDIDKRKDAAAANADVVPLTPSESQRIRNSIANMIQLQLEKAHAFVMADARSFGTNKDGSPTTSDRDYPHAQPMNAQQVRIFTALLNKVVPDLNASFVQKATSKNPDEMSRADLEELVASQNPHTIHREKPGRDTSADPKRPPTLASHPMIEDAELLEDYDLMRGADKDAETVPEAYPDALIDLPPFGTPIIDDGPGSEDVGEPIFTDTIGSPDAPLSAEDAVLELRRLLAASGQSLEDLEDTPDDSPDT